MFCNVRLDGALVEDDENKNAFAIVGDAITSLKVDKKRNILVPAAGKERIVGIANETVLDLVRKPKPQVQGGESEGEEAEEVDPLDEVRAVVAPAMLARHDAATTSEADDEVKGKHRASKWMATAFIILAVGFSSALVLSILPTALPRIQESLSGMGIGG